MLTSLPSPFQKTYPSFINYCTLSQLRHEDQTCRKGLVGVQFVISNAVVFEIANELIKGLKTVFLKGSAFKHALEKFTKGLVVTKINNYRTA